MLSADSAFFEFNLRPAIKSLEVSVFICANLWPGNLLFAIIDK
jgi:hypothetical protein